MSPQPLFSIITVTFQAENTLAATMESVAAQTFSDYEHIIMDGVSADQTLAIANRLATVRAQIHSSPDKGIYDAMNKAIGKATGQYLIFLNAGDRFHSPDTLKQLAAIALAHGNDNPGIIYGQTNLVDSQGNFIAPRHLTAPRSLSLSSFKDGMVVCHQAFCVLRRIAPLYDTRWRFSADYEWCIRCLMHSRNNAYTGNVVIDYLNEGMTTNNLAASLKERFKIMAHYYGLLPTIWRHFKFVGRGLWRKIASKGKAHQ